MTDISCVLFDIGGVIVNWQNSWFTQEISDEFQLSHKKLSLSFDKHLTDISIGKINEKEFWHNIGSELQSKELMNLNESLLDKIFRKHVSLNDSIVSLSKDLFQKGMTLGILSNIEPVVYSVVSDLISLGHFKYKFLSYQIGNLKPEFKIYNYVIEHIPFPKEELFFIDDLKTNVESARSCGIDSVQYFDHDELLKECQIRQIL